MVIRKTFSLARICFLFVVLVGCTSNKSLTPVLLKSPPSGWVIYSALISHEPFITQIYLLNLDSGNTEQLTFSGNNAFPRWSPDGSQIIYASWTKENSYDIYLMNKDGSDQHAIIATSSSERLAEWSPEGDKLVYVSNESGIDQIYLMNLISLEKVQLTNLPAGVYSASWSSDGKKIAFLSNTGVAGRSQVFVMNSTGIDVKQLTPYNIDHFDGEPTWCPSDSCIVFTRLMEGVPKLMILDIKGKNAVPLLSNTFDATLQETRLSRSPIKGYITFSAGEKFYAMDVTTRKIYPLNIEGLDLSLYP